MVADTFDIPHHSIHSTVHTYPDTTHNPARSTDNFSDMLSGNPDKPTDMVAGMFDIPLMYTDNSSDMLSGNPDRPSYMLSDTFDIPVQCIDNSVHMLSDTFGIPQQYTDKIVHMLSDNSGRIDTPLNTLSGSSGNSDSPSCMLFGTPGQRIDIGGGIQFDIGFHILGHMPWVQSNQ